jgi:hypothetical protein
MIASAMTLASGVVEEAPAAPGKMEGARRTGVTEAVATTTPAGWRPFTTSAGQDAVPAGPECGGSVVLGIVLVLGLLKDES